VFFGVVLTRFLRMMGRVKMMSVRYMRLMAGLFMLTSFVMFCCLPMVLSRVFVMFCRVAMVLRSFMISHSSFLFRLIFEHWVDRDLMSP
jgi:hypothetical protein